MKTLVEHKVGESFKVEIDKVQAVGRVDNSESGDPKVYVEYFVGDSKVSSEDNFFDYINRSDIFKSVVGKVHTDENFPKTLLVTENGDIHIGKTVKEVYDETVKLCDENNYHLWSY